MNTSISGRLFVLLIIGLFLIPGWATAIRPTSALYDDTGLTTTIDATCVGTLMVQHDMEWSQLNTPSGSLDNNTLAPDEVRATIAYRENTLAVAGATKYTKEYSMDGSNVSEGNDNLDVTHMVNFQADESQNGRMLYDEQATITADGRGTNNQTAVQCVFAQGSGSSLGGFSGSVSAGSLMDVQEVAAVTTVGGRAISENPQVPVSLRYGFDAQGLETDTKDNLATGSATVYTDTSFEIGDVNDANISTRLQDHQQTVARGLFDLAQAVGYTSTY